MWMPLRLPNRFSAIFEDHHRSITRRQITIQLTPQARHRIHFVYRQLREGAVVLTVVDHHISLTNRWLQRWEVVGVQPDLLIWPNTSLCNVSTKWAGGSSFAAIHAVRCIDKILSKDRI